MKLKELSNQDIDKRCAGDRNYGGCFSKDKLPRVIGKKYYILNMQNEKDGNGTHWVMLDNRSPKQVRYFDSMGEVPPTVVARLMRQTGKPKAINKFQLQPMGSSTCGWWCLAAEKALSHMPMEDFISHFSLDDPKANDKMLAKLF